MPLARFALLALLAVGGCATTPLAARNARWRALETAHFTLYTDQPSARAEESARELEQLLHAMLETGWVVQGELPIQLNVVMFARPSDFDRYAGRDVGGYYRGNILYESWIVLPATGAGPAVDLLRHELAHDIAYTALQYQPPWFAEGLATYFQTARFEPGNLR